MPNGLWFAGGDTATMETAIPSSAFSKGDLLQFDSNSSLSRMNVLFPSGADIAGVAVCDSTDSIENKVSYIVPGPDTLFWASANSASGNAFVPGSECDVLYSTANNRYYVDPGSTNSVRAVVVRGVSGVGAPSQSVQSKVLCRLIYHAGNLEL